MEMLDEYLKLYQEVHAAFGKTTPIAELKAEFLSWKRARQERELQSIRSHAAIIRVSDKSDKS